MAKLRPYTKAIVVAVGSTIAVVVGIARGDDPEGIQAATQTVIGIITAILTYALPNTPETPSEPSE